MGAGNGPAAGDYVRMTGNPEVAEVGFHLISNRGKKLSPVVDGFTEFLKHYIAGWAGRFGAL